MGYPMYWERLRRRNGLSGDYEQGIVQGDMQRVEKNTMDDLHLTMYARYAGITYGQARKVFEAFFSPNLSLLQGVLTDAEWRVLYDSVQDK